MLLFLLNKVGIDDNNDNYLAEWQHKHSSRKDVIKPSG